MKIRLSLCFALLFPAFLFAQPQPAQEPNGLLWRITGPDIKPSYLYGTIHLPDSRLMILRDSVLSAIRKSDVFANEVNLDSQFAEMASALYKAVNLATSPNEADMLKLENMMDGMKSTLELIGKNVLPIMKKSAISKPNADPNLQAMDYYLYRIAKQEGKRITGLESFSSQFNLLGKIYSQRSLEKTMMSEIAFDSNAVRRWLDYYYADDLRSIEMELDQMYTQKPDMYNEIFTRRDLEMTERLLKLAGDKRAFLAVGAGHLRGILRELKNRGYVCEVIKSERKKKAKPFEFKPQVSALKKFSDGYSGFQVLLPSDAMVLQHPVTQGGFLMLSTDGSKFGSLAAQFRIGFKDRDKEIQDLPEKVYKEMLKAGKRAPEVLVLSSGTSTRPDGLKLVQAMIFMAAPKIYLRVQMMQAGRELLTNLAWAAQEKELLTPRFDSMFNLVQRVVPQPAVWRRMSSASSAFSAEMPGSPVFTGLFTSGLKNRSSVRGWSSYDPGSGLSYKIQSFNIPYSFVVDREVTSDVYGHAWDGDAPKPDSLSKPVRALVNMLRLNSETPYTIVPVKDPAAPKGMAYLLKATMNGDEFPYLNAYIRGHRMVSYSVKGMAADFRSHRKDVEQFFSSVQPLQPCAARYRNEQSPNGDFSVRLPGLLHPVLMTEKNKSSSRYGDDYYVFDGQQKKTIRLAEYFSVDSCSFTDYHYTVDSLMPLMRFRTRGQFDTFVMRQTGLNENAVQMTYTIRSMPYATVVEGKRLDETFGVWQVVKRIATGYRLITATAFVPVSLGDSAMVPVKSLSVSASQGLGWVTTPKLQYIILQMRSSDPEQSKTAYNILKSYEPEKLDAQVVGPVILDSAFRWLCGDSYEVRALLFTTMAKADPAQALILARSLPSAFMHDDKMFQALMEFLLLEPANSQGLSLAEQIIRNGNCRKNMNAWQHLAVFFNLNPAAGAKLFPALAEMWQSSPEEVPAWFFDPLVVNIPEQKDNPAYQRLVRAKTDYFLKHPEVLAADGSEEWLNRRSSMEQLTLMLCSQKNEAALNTVAEIKKVFPLARYGAMAEIARIRAGSKPDLEYISKASASVEARMPLYLGLQQLGIDSLMPKGFRTPRALAASDVWNNAIRQRADLDTLRFLREKTTGDGDQKGTYYLFKISKISIPENTKGPAPDASTGEDSYNTGEVLADTVEALQFILGISGPHNRDAKAWQPGNYTGIKLYFDSMGDTPVEQDLMLKEYLGSFREAEGDLVEWK